MSGTAQTWPSQNATETYPRNDILIAFQNPTRLRNFVQTHAHGYKGVEKGENI
jgi:hypothetical protein